MDGLVREIEREHAELIEQEHEDDHGFSEGFAFNQVSLTLDEELLNELQQDNYLQVELNVLVLLHVPALIPTLVLQDQGDKNLPKHLELMVPLVRVFDRLLYLLVRPEVCEDPFEESDAHLVHLSQHQILGV